MDGESTTGRSPRQRGLEQSLTLLRLFLLASALICVVAGVVLGWLLSHTLTSQALDSERSSLVAYVDGVARPQLVRGNQVVVSRWGQSALLGMVRGQGDIVTVKVWRADGVLAWTNRQQRRIGRRFPLDDLLGDAILHNKPVAALVGTGNTEGEDSFERNKLGFSHLFEVYAPIESTDGSRAIGAYEIYANPAALDRLIGSRKHMLWAALAAVLAALWAALALLVRSASRTLRRQNEKLRVRTARLVESNRLLEQSALDAVESLNATVDAKDPYTAGHSHRVQRIALALGEELGLDAPRLRTLGFSALFHDIGKIGVPDAILTKPAKLTDDEYEVIKRHPEDGAKIVSRLHQLEEAVPAILHHHERWDGRGYPSLLAGEAIPVEARIVGLADALDAMTTDRPYSPARPLHEAATEILGNRGTQFAPDVVDAFLRVLERAPAVFEPLRPWDEAAVAV
ncbi:MAG: HD-GYP domain-containing protein [Actinobacteria bacterium]|nr:HD-GYP domain-containing protein [Actinomycetota bacterium]